jgi:CheY-like chemotaxis protein
MERRLAHAQKMEAVGQLTGGIAHDFNNLLQVVQTNIEMARQRTAEDEKARDCLDRALAAGQRGAKLTGQLLSFSRKQLLQPRAVDANRLVEDLIRLLARTLGEDIAVESVLEAGLPAILADPHSLENALLNLVVNARAAMPRGGRLTVTTRNARLDEERVLMDGVLAAGGYVEIAVSDTGCGMSAEVLEHAFEPFYTTKRVGEGSGLGLSMVYGFARQSGGLATLESEPGKGTAVRLLLPVARSAAARDERPETADGGNGTGKILVVEDDPDVRGSAVLVLRSCGYAVREADDGASALAILEADPGIDLLFSDVVMPKGMNGFDLAREATRRRPDLKVVLTSGYPDAALEKTGLAKTQFRVLGKPYAKKDLVNVLADMLNGDGG